MRNAKKGRTARIAPPEAPETEGYAAAPPDLQGKFVHEDVRVRDADLAEVSGSGVQLERVAFERVVLARANLRSLTVQDGRFDGCDMAGSVWDRAHLTRVELDGCRLVGASFDRATFTDARATGVNAEMALFINAGFTAARFDRCNLRGASFDGADLRGVVFRDCDLRTADLRNCKLEGADLRGSQIDGAMLEVARLRGVILDPGQAMDVIALLGVTVSSLEDAPDR